jgi:hypothetical protein
MPPIHRLNTELFKWLRLAGVVSALGLMMSITNSAVNAQFGSFGGSTAIPVSAGRDGENGRRLFIVSICWIEAERK